MKPKKRKLRGLLGKTAIANSKVMYEQYTKLYSDTNERWQKLKAQDANPQRLLWASTSTKNPALPDTYYVEALIGKDTVDTMPPATVNAFRDHGKDRRYPRTGYGRGTRNIEASRRRRY